MVKVICAARMSLTCNKFKNCRIWFYDSTWFIFFTCFVWIYFLCCFIFMLISWIGNARDHLKTLCFIRVETYLGGDQPYLNWLIIDTGAYFRKVELLAPLRLVKTRMVMVMVTTWCWQYGNDNKVMTINNISSCATCLCQYIVEEFQYRFYHSS